ncbi:retrotransposon protein, putative, ty1-copia subclass [Tanacetum coccineum]
MGLSPIELLLTRHNIMVSEKRNRTLLDMVRSMMSQTTLPKSFWDYALETAARILNMVPTKKVEKTPYKVWHGQAPKLYYLKVWGCEALVKRDTLTKPDKIEHRSIKCVFVGYPKKAMGYSFYYPPENKVIVARNAEFLENSMINQEASRSTEDLEIIQEEDTHHSINTNSHHEEDDLKIDEPQVILFPFVGDLNEPANYKAALLDPESDKWLDGMNVEMQSMKDNKVWDLVDLTPDGKTVTSKWLFKKKTNMDRVNITSQFQENLGDLHWTAVKNILKYLKNTKDMFLVYEGDIKRELVVSCYTNAGYLTDADGLKSQTRYVFVLNRGVVDWKSTKQSIFATSSVEAEYIVAYDAYKEVEKLL